METFRDPIYRNHGPNLHLTLISALMVSVTLAVGAAVFQRSRDRIPYDL